MNNIIFLIFIATILSSCGLSQKKALIEEEPLINIKELPKADTLQTKEAGETDPIDILISEAEPIDIQPIIEEEPPQVEEIAPVKANSLKGFRVQIEAFQNSISAKNVKKQAEIKLNTQGYIVEENGLWKVRMGNFLERSEAEKFKMEVKEKFYAGAFIVESEIGTPTKNKVISSNSIGKYSLQIFAGTEKNANSFAEKVRKMTGEQVFVEYSEMDGLSKVKVGNFQNRIEAKAASENFKNIQINGENLKPFVVTNE